MSDNRNQIERIPSIATAGLSMKLDDLVRGQTGYILNRAGKPWAHIYADYKNNPRKVIALPSPLDWDDERIVQPDSVNALLEVLIEALTRAKDPNNKAMYVRHGELGHVNFDKAVSRLITDLRNGPKVDPETGNVVDSISVEYIFHQFDLKAPSGSIVGKVRVVDGMFLTGMERRESKVRPIYQELADYVINDQSGKPTLELIKHIIEESKSYGLGILVAIMSGIGTNQLVNFLATNKQSLNSLGVRTNEFDPSDPRHIQALVELRALLNPDDRPLGTFNPDAQAAAHQLISANGDNSRKLAFFSVASLKYLESRRFPGFINRPKFLFRGVGRNAVDIVNDHAEFTGFRDPADRKSVV